MKKNNFYKMLSCALLLTVILCMNTIAYACWNILTVDEMIEKSDTIVIGKIVKRIGKTKNDTSYTDWKVKVNYYLKGEIREEFLTVSTPSIELSIFYNLGEIGEEVLLFMHAKEDHGTPLSPQGVITLTLDDNISDDSNIISGKDLESHISINETNLDEESMVKLEEFIKSRDVFLPNETPPQNSNNILLYVYIIVGIGILILFLKFAFGFVAGRKHK